MLLGGSTLWGEEDVAGEGDDMTANSDAMSVSELRRLEDQAAQGCSFGRCGERPNQPGQLPLASVSYGTLVCFQNQTCDLFQGGYINTTYQLRNEEIGNK